jgi:hypothetical protein
MDKGAIQGQPEYQDQAESRRSAVTKNASFGKTSLAISWLNPLRESGKTRFLTQRLELSRFAAPRVCEPLHQDQSDRGRIPANLLFA